MAIGGPSDGKRYELAQECSLGRSFNSDIYIGDLNVSRRHARINFTQSGYQIEDLGSGNGTFVNEAKVNRRVLSHTDVVRIGGSAFRFEEELAPGWGEEVQTVIADLTSGALANELGIDAHIVTRDGATPEGLDPGSGLISIQPAEPVKLSQEEEHRRLTKMLEAMYAVADAIATELDLDRLLNKILDHLFDVFPQAERGFVLMLNSETGQLVPEAVRQRSSGSTDGLRFSQTIVDQVMTKGQGIIRGTTQGYRPATRPARPAVPNPPPTSDLPTPKIGAPLTCRGESLGTLHLEGRPDGSPFSADDLALLSAIARQAAMALANARAGQALLIQQRLEADLQLARKIQQSFLPQRLPEVASVAFEAHYLPAHHVGGDFYDVIQLSPARIGVLMGDISGKGVSAALLMAKVSSDIRQLALAGGSPAEILSQANRLLMDSGNDAMFATALYLMLDLDSKTFTVANAGHQPPMVCSIRFEGISELDDATAVALGVVPDMEYPQEVYELVPGDVIVLYTDGINEAMNRQGQEYGMQRLRQALVAGPVEPKHCVQRVIRDARRFVGGAAQSDDQTVVALGLSS